LSVPHMLLMSLICAGGALATASQSAHAAAPLQSSCKLNSVGHKIQRVVHITFDNVHLTRDDPNVPSDLEQMPNLLNFLQNNGVVSGNHHTPLISHTANDILTALTGVYPDRHGVPVANSYGFFRQDGSISIGNPSFLYWTAKSADGQPLMINENGKTHPAPWVPFTRAGCDFGAFSVANMEFESVPADVQTVFGSNSQQAQNIVTILTNNPKDNNFAHQQARQSVNTDWLGVAVHCAQGSPLCSGPNGAADALPDEPGGYANFLALFGNVNAAPVICAKATNP